MTPVTAGPVIDVHDLCKSFGDRRVVDGLSLTVPEGEICGFLGGNHHPADLRLADPG